MTVSYIEQIRNATQRSIFMWAKDKEHLGEFHKNLWFADEWAAGSNEGDMTFTIFPRTEYTGSWCGIPWYSGSDRYRAISTSRDRGRSCLWMSQQATGGTDGINYYSSKGFELRYRQVFDSGSGSSLYTLRIEPGKTAPKIFMANMDGKAKEKYLDVVKDKELDADTFAQRLGQLTAGG